MRGVWGGVGHVVGLAFAAALTLLLLYASRFWVWRAPFDGRELFGLDWLRPGGDVVRRLLRGSTLTEFDIVIWGAGGIVALSLLAMIGGLFHRGE